MPMKRREERSQRRASSDLIMATSTGGGAGSSVTRYRSMARILNPANAVIANNPHVFEKKLWSQHGLGELIRVVTCPSELPVCYLGVCQNAYCD